jgi:hypothetical protein
MNHEPIDRTSDPTSSPAPEIPLAQPSLDSAIEASVANTKRRLQADIDAFAGRELPIDSMAADSHDGSGSSPKTLRPYWIPPDMDLSDWSPELLAEVAALINPLYLELVHSVQAPLARSIGCTIVYLHWLEIIDQLKIGSGSPERDLARLQRLVGGESRPAMIDRYLRVVGAKLRFSHFLLRLQEIKQRHDQSDAPRAVKTSKRRNSTDYESQGFSPMGIKWGRPPAEIMAEIRRRNSELDR